ncbi:MAG: succinylglutamate-semialdehyde dehydrogenase, partial [Pseudomonadota bacterium]
SSPATGATVAEGRTASSAQAEAALSAASDMFPPWSATPYEERLTIIERFAEIAAERKEELATLIAKESGKALWDARGEASGVAGKAALATAAYNERTPTTERQASGGLKLRLAHHPHGVMVVIGPFNFPAHLPNGQIIPSLLAGNSVVFKPSEQTPAAGQLMASWWEEAGLPSGVLNLVHGGRAVAEALIVSDKTNGVLFTGGIEAGRAIHKSLAGRPEVLLALELGGNNPLVAWDVADHDAAARIIVRSAYISAGQRCTCARRLIVGSGKAGDRIIEAVAALIPKLTIGDPLADPSPFIGPVISAESAAAGLEAQSTLLADGARALVPMANAPAGEAFLSPGLIDVTDMAEDPDEEIFAPLLKVVRVHSFDAAITKANATRFGLAAGLLSDRPALWEAFRQQIRAGIVNWNRQTTGASGAMPFGGPGLSGNHRPAGYYAADFAAWPMASMIADGPLTDNEGIPGVSL